jgi:hypothetical protein
LKASLPLEVKLGDSFIVSASCPPNKERTDYELSIAVEYNITGSSSHTETGRIKSCIGCVNGP